MLDTTDILVSHSPPRFHLDVNGFGDDNLLGEVKRIKPKLHVFGHVHEGYGSDMMMWDDFQFYYEEICRGIGGLWCLMEMVYLLLLLVTGFCRQDFSQATVAVNASAVDGLRDNVRRKAIVHCI